MFDTLIPILKSVSLSIGMKLSPLSRYKVRAFITEGTYLYMYADA